MRVRTKLGTFVGTMEELKKLNTSIICKGYLEGEEHNDPFTVKLYLDALTAISMATLYPEEAEETVRNYNDIHVSLGAFGSFEGDRTSILQLYALLWNLYHETAEPQQKEEYRTAWYPLIEMLEYTE